MNPPRNDPFVPLVALPPPNDDRAEFRVTIVGPADGAKPVPIAAPRVHAPNAAGGAACEPRVTLLRDGDSVSAIRIECVCGHVIERNCIYEPGK